MKRIENRIRPPARYLGPAVAVLLAMAGPGAAQAPSWDKLVIPGGIVWQDPNWKTGGDDFQPKGLLAADRSGRIYWANGSRLLIGSKGGTVWRRLEKEISSPEFLRKRALGAGAEGAVIWGEVTSRDGGTTWDSTSRSYWSYSCAILKDGTALLGQSLDGIERSIWPGETWDWVHQGHTFGHIVGFAVSDAGRHFALPMIDGLLHSVDNGKTWKEWTHPTQKTEFNGNTIRAMEFQTASGNPLLLAMKKPESEKGNLLVRVHTVYPQVDTLKTLLPDSPATSLQVTSDGVIWLGTRGQGVWVSRDQGNTFTPRNGGLGSLFVEALEATSNGDLFVFTRDGLYKARMGGTFLRHARQGTPLAGTGRFVLHLASLPSSLQPGAGRTVLKVQADGRMLIRPDVHSLGGEAAGTPTPSSR